MFGCVTLDITYCGHTIGQEGIKRELLEGVVVDKRGREGKIKIEPHGHTTSRRGWGKEV